MKTGTESEVGELSINKIINRCTKLVFWEKATTEAVFGSEGAISQDETGGSWEKALQTVQQDGQVSDEEIIPISNETLSMHDII